MDNIDAAQTIYRQGGIIAWVELMLREMRNKLWKTLSESESSPHFYVVILSVIASW